MFLKRSVLLRARHFKGLSPFVWYIPVRKLSSARVGDERSVFSKAGKDRLVSAKAGLQALHLVLAKKEQPLKQIVNNQAKTTETLVNTPETTINRDYIRH